MSYGFIYCTVNLVTGTKYIGMCKSTHANGYLGSGKILKKAIKLYGRDNFSREILENCETFEELSSAETKWILHFDAVNSDEYYNLHHGGFGGNSESTKEYWSQFTKEERKLIRKWDRSSQKGSLNPMFGRVHSEETKLKIGAKSINRNWGRKSSIIGENNPRAKPVILYKLDGVAERFGCIKDISHKYGYNYSTLKSIIKNNTFTNKYGVEITYA